MDPSPVGVTLVLLIVFATIQIVLQSQRRRALPTDLSKQRDVLARHFGLYRRPTQGPGWWGRTDHVGEWSVWLFADGFRATVRFREALPVPLAVIPISVASAESDDELDGHVVESGDPAFDQQFTVCSHASDEDVLALLAAPMRDALLQTSEHHVLRLDHHGVLIEGRHQWAKYLVEQATDALRNLESIARAAAAVVHEPAFIEADDQRQPGVAGDAIDDVLPPGSLDETFSAPLLSRVGSVDLASDELAIVEPEGSARLDLSSSFTAHLSVGRDMTDRPILHLTIRQKHGDVWTTAGLSARWPVDSPGLALLPALGHRYAFVTPDVMHKVLARVRGALQVLGCESWA